jgi:hypothetical protein
MYSTFRFYGRSLAVAATAATVMLAGCGGSQMANPATQLNPQARVPVSSAFGVTDDLKCNGGGPVKVDPCRVHFTRKNDAAVAVSVKYPGDPKGTLTESDNCGTRATITGSGGSWTVTPEKRLRRCRAIFVYSSNGKAHGSAVLRIDNRDRHRKH